VLKQEGGGRSSLKAVVEKVLMMKVMAKNLDEDTVDWNQDILSQYQCKVMRMNDRERGRVDKGEQSQVPMESKNM